MGKEKKLERGESDRKDGGPLQAVPSPSVLTLTTKPTINTATNPKVEMVLWRTTALKRATTAKTGAMVNTGRAALAVAIPK